MAIQHRRGVFNKFDPTKLLPGEYAVVLSGDDGPSDGKAVYICFAAGDVKRIATVNDMAEYMDQMTEEVIAEITTEVEEATEAATEAAGEATEAASEASSAATAAQEAAEAAEAIVDYNVPLMSSTQRGGAKLGAGLQVGADEKLGIMPATASTIGGVKADGTTITVDPDGTLHGSSSYSLPTMSPTTKGGAKLGDGLSIEDDALNLGPLVKSTTPDTPIDGSGIFGVQGEGWAEQDTTPSINLFALNDYVFRSGVPEPTLTFSDNGVTVSNANFSAGGRFVAFNVQVQPNTTYTFSFDKANSTVGGVVQLFVRSSRPTSALLFSNPYTQYSTESQFTFTTASDAAYAQIQFEISQNGTILKPQLELGSTASSYVPYTGIVPNPDHPREIKVARGRNLLDGLSDYFWYAPGGEHVNSLANFVGSESKYPCNVGEQYVFSSQKFLKTIVAVFYDSSDSYLSYLSTSDAYQFSFVVPQGAKKLAISLGLASGTLHPSDIVNAQLELGTTPTPYVPYGHVGLEVQSRNLFNINGYQALGGFSLSNGTLSATNNNYNPFKSNKMHLAPGQYTISFDTTSANSNYNVEVHEPSDTGLRPYIHNIDSSGRYSDTFTIETDAIYEVRFYGRSSSSGSISISNVQVAAGTLSVYEPYSHTTTPIPLPAKGFAAKVGDYADTLEVDSAGGYEWNTQFKMSVHSSGFASWENKNGSKQTYVNLSGYLKTTGSNYFSNIAVYGDVNASSVTKPVFQISSTGSAYVRIPDSMLPSGVTDVSSFNTWASTHPVEFLHTTTPATESGYIALPALSSGATVTIPELDNVGVDYWVHGAGEVVEHVNNVYKRVEAALAEIATS